MKVWLAPLLLLTSPLLAADPPAPPAAPLPPQPNVIDPTIPVNAPSNRAVLKAMMDRTLKLSQEQQDIAGALRYMRFDAGETLGSIDQLYNNIGDPLPPIIKTTRIHPRQSVGDEPTPVVPPVVPAPPIPPQPTPVPDPREEAKTPTLAIPVYVSGEVGDFIEVTATTNAQVVAWRVIDPGLKLFPIKLQVTSLTATVTAQKPGSYRMIAVAAVNGTAVIAETTVNVAGPVLPTPEPDKPRPAPIPPPAPTPQPVSAAKVTVVLIDDAVRRTPATAALLVDLSYWEGMSTVVDHVHVVPAADPIAKQYAAQVAQAGGVPCVILMSFPGNKVLTAQALPADKVAMTALISKYTGGK